MNEDLEALYQDLILDHYKNPRCKGSIENASASVTVDNPICGDKITLSLAGDPTCINQIRFSGKGCAISQASASMMADACQGKSLSEVQSLVDTFVAFMHERAAPDELKAVSSDLVALEGVKKFTARIKCALLSWEALGRCLEQIKSAKN